MNRNDTQFEIELLKIAAEAGDSASQYKLGYCYDNGLNVKRSVSEAIKWYELAAEQGHCEAILTLGIFCGFGRGTLANGDKAAEWFSKIPRGEVVSVLFHNLGNLTFSDDGKRESTLLKTARWMRFNYKDGRVSQEIDTLGPLGGGNIGYPAEDLQGKIDWLTSLAEGGDAMVQAYLGDCYRDGIGVTKNAEKTVKWYRLAAAQNHIDAQFGLGVCYDQGFGVKQDAAEAVKWWLLSANQGDAVSQFNLAICYGHGKGVEKNLDEAAKWLNLAKQQEDVLKSVGIDEHEQDSSGEVTPDFVGNVSEDKVKEWREKAEAGNAYAQYNLAICYRFGRGVKQNLPEALKWYRKSARQGFSPAIHNLAVCYEKGLGTPKDIPEAMRWYRFAASQGDTDSQLLLSVHYNDKGKPWYSKAKCLKWCRVAAERGNVDAQLYLALLLLNQDVKEAVKWCNKAADNGNEEAERLLQALQEQGLDLTLSDSESQSNSEDFSDSDSIKIDETAPEAQYQLGLRYFSGDKIKQDFNKAISCFYRAAEQGHGLAQYCLGFCYDTALGVEYNRTEAAKWYRKAARNDKFFDSFSGSIPCLGIFKPRRTKIVYNVENDLAEQYRISAEKGSAEAQYQLARRYEEGDGLSKDIDEALKLYLKAAEQGHCGAQLRLGHIYYWGEDVKQDYNESNKWYRQAAEQGDMCAQYCLGLAYTEGLGTPQNDMEAVKWYRKSAEQGYKDAQCSLGFCYEYGCGVVQNYKEAIKWYRKASAQGQAEAHIGLERCLKKRPQ